MKIFTMAPWAACSWLQVSLSTQTLQRLRSSQACLPVTYLWQTDLETQSEATRSDRSMDRVQLVAFPGMWVRGGFLGR